MKKQLRTLTALGAGHQVACFRVPLEHHIALGETARPRPFWQLGISASFSPARKNCLRRPALSPLSTEFRCR